MFKILKHPKNKGTAKVLPKLLLNKQKRKENLNNSQFSFSKMNSGLNKVKFDKNSQSKGKHGHDLHVS